jgi:hypothetical protein
MVDICQPKQKGGCESMGSASLGRVKSTRRSPEKIRICGCEPIANPAWQDNDSLFSPAGAASILPKVGNAPGSLQGRSQGCFSGGVDKYVVFRIPALPWDVQMP